MPRRTEGGTRSTPPPRSTPYKRPKKKTIPPPPGLVGRRGVPTDQKIATIWAGEQNLFPWEVARKPLIKPSKYRVPLAKKKKGRYADFPTEPLDRRYRWATRIAVDPVARKKLAGSMSARRRQQIIESTRPQLPHDAGFLESIAEIPGRMAHGPVFGPIGRGAEALGLGTARFLLSPVTNYGQGRPPMVPTSPVLRAGLSAGRSPIVAPGARVGEAVYKGISRGAEEYTGPNLIDVATTGQTGHPWMAGIEAAALAPPLKVLRVVKATKAFGIAKWAARGLKGEDKAKVIRDTFEQVMGEPGLANALKIRKKPAYYSPDRRETVKVLTSEYGTGAEGKLAVKLADEVVESHVASLGDDVTRAERVQAAKEAYADIARQTVGHRVADEDIDRIAESLYHYIRPGQELLGKDPQGFIRQGVANIVRHTQLGLKFAPEAPEWYEQSAKRILAATNGNLDEAEKLLQLIGIYSAQTEVTPNLGLALKAYRQFKVWDALPAAEKATRPPISVHKLRDPDAIAVLRDKVDWPGRKRNTFYRNLLAEMWPERYKELVQQGLVDDVTVDRHMNTMFDLPESASAHYSLVQDAIRGVADLFKMQRSHLQATAWVSRKAEKLIEDGDAKTWDEAWEKARTTYADALDRQEYLTRFPFESRPGNPEIIPDWETWSPAVQRAHLRAKVPLVEEFFRRVGLPFTSRTMGAGFWINEAGQLEINPAFAFDLHTGFQLRKSEAGHFAKVGRDLTLSQEQHELYDVVSTFLGWALHQSNASWFKPMLSANRNQSRLALVRAGKVTKRDMDRIAKAFKGTDTWFSHGDDGVYIAYAEGDGSAFTTGQFREKVESLARNWNSEVSWHGLVNNYIGGLDALQIEIRNDPRFGAYADAADWLRGASDGVDDVFRLDPDVAARELGGYAGGKSVRVGESEATGGLRRGADLGDEGRVGADRGAFGEVAERGGGRDLPQLRRVAGEDPHEYIAAVERNPEAGNTVIVPTPHRLARAKGAFLREDGEAGFAVSHDNELFAVFRNGGEGGWGRHAALAGADEGAEWLRVAEDNIPATKGYSRGGFVQVARYQKGDGTWKAFMALGAKVLGIKEFGEEKLAIAYAKAAAATRRLVHEEEGAIRLWGRDAVDAADNAGPPVVPDPVGKFTVKKRVKQLRKTGLDEVLANRIANAEALVKRMEFNRARSVAGRPRIVANNQLADAKQQLDELLDRADRQLQGIPDPDAGFTALDDEVARHAQTIRDSMKEIRTAQAEIDRMRSPTLAQAAGHAEAAMQEFGGREGFYEAMRRLRGERPTLEFGPFKEFSDEGVEGLFRYIQQTPLRTFEKLRTQRALLLAINGKVPTRSELKLLEQVFGPEVANNVRKAIPWHAKLRRAGVEIWNLPRSLVASFDLSAPFRQGLMMGFSHPVLFFRNFGLMVKAWGSERVYNEIMDDIAMRQNFPLMQKARLALTDLENLSSREEQFMSNWAEYVPLVRRSGRAYTGFLNKLRADVFDHLIKEAEESGAWAKAVADGKDDKLLESLGKFINSATGRGDIGWLEPAAVALNTVLFSPRLLFSRLNFLWPPYYARMHPVVRREALKSVARMMGSIGVILFLMDKSGIKTLGGTKANIELDPRNANFAKIRLGNTRLDILGGFQQPVRLMAQVLSGKIISSTTGKELRLNSGEFASMTRRDIIERFIESKFSPSASFVNDFFKGSDFEGKPFAWKKAILTRMIPLASQDAYDLAKEQGGQPLYVYNNKGGIPFWGGDLSLPSLGQLGTFAGAYGVGGIGLGIQTYGGDEDKRGGGGSTRRSSRSSRSHGRSHGR